MIDIAGASREAIGDAPPSVEAGWGLWLTLMASVVLTVAAYRFQAQVTGRRISFRVDARHALIGLLAIGLVLRILLCLVWSPAMTGYSDSGVYFAGAVESLWTDPIRMVGYSMFLACARRYSASTRGRGRAARSWSAGRGRRFLHGASERRTAMAWPGPGGSPRTWRR